MLNRLPVVVIESSIVSVRFVFRRAQHSRNQEPQEECELHNWRHCNSYPRDLWREKEVRVLFAQVKNEVTLSGRLLGFVWAAC